MNRVLLKWIGLLAMTTLAVLAASRLLVARLSPGAATRTISPEVASPEPVPPNPANITWTPTSTEAIVSPGETKTISVSFVSSRNIRRASVEISPGLGQLIRAEPASFEKIRKGQQRAINLVIDPTANATLGTVTGTIQLRRGKVDKNDPDCDDDDRRDQGKLLPEELTVTVNVWPKVTDNVLGVRLAYPPGWTVLAEESGYTFSSVPGRREREGGVGEEISLSVGNNFGGLSLQDWLMVNLGIDVSTAPPGSVKSGVLIGGQTYIQLIDVVPAEDPDNIHTFIASGPRVFVLRVSPASDFGALYELMLSTVSAF